MSSVFLLLSFLALVQSEPCPRVCSENFWICISQTVNNECAHCVRSLQGKEVAACPQGCDPTREMVWLCPSELTPRLIAQSGFIVLVTAPWIQGAGGQRIRVQQGEPLETVAERVGIRLGAPIGSEVTLCTSSLKALNQTNELQPGMRLHATVTTRCYQDLVTEEKINSSYC